MAREIEFRWDGLDVLIKDLKDFGKQAEKELESEMQLIAARWGSEAQRRVPVETGLLRNTIFHESGKEGGEHYAAVGSNQDYAPHIEFGTDWIAGGAVKALGLSPEITDAQAVTSWPAKDANATGGSMEQMPFLRPAFMAIRDWALKRLENVLRMK
jgi:hypothetical protein